MYFLWERKIRYLIKDLEMYEHSQENFRHQNFNEFSNNVLSLIKIDTQICLENYLLMSYKYATYTH